MKKERRPVFQHQSDTMTRSITGGGVGGAQFANTRGRAGVSDRAGRDAIGTRCLRENEKKWTFRAAFGRLGESGGNRHVATAWANDPVAARDNASSGFDRASDRPLSILARNSPTAPANRRTSAFIGGCVLPGGTGGVRNRRSGATGPASAIGKIGAAKIGGFVQWNT